MTEQTETPDASLPPAIERFVVRWGEMGETWGVNRSIAQIHALLLASAHPLTAEEIGGMLKIARSNVSTSLRELTAWSLVRRVATLGDRRERFEAEADMLEMVRRIAAGRKAREFAPAVDALRDSADAARRDTSVSPEIRRRLEDLLAFTETVDRSFDQVLALPSPVLARLIKLGGALARFVAPHSNA